MTGKSEVGGRGADSNADRGSLEPQIGAAIGADSNAGLRDEETLVFHDDLEAQTVAISFLESKAKLFSALPGCEIRHDNFERSDGCTSTLWAQGKLRAVAVRVRNDWNRTVLTVWPK